jgi:hypothetical protein
MVYINGLAALNMTAIGGSAGNGSEYTVAVSGGAGGVCRLSFGGNLSNGDSVHVVYFT